MNRLPAAMGPAIRPRKCRVRASRQARSRASRMRPTGGAIQEAHWPQPRKRARSRAQNQPRTKTKMETSSVR
eukprot:9087594-Pyramimonas_sp.AAC.1